ncbi:hypothetical protein Trydic_g5054 [Trypoxylus dichotomus]
MFRIVLLVAVVCSTSALPRRAPRLDGRVVGGIDADIADHNYQVSLQYFGSHVCGGSLVSPDYVVTAAHCTYGATPYGVTARAGSSVLGSGGYFAVVITFTEHPNFDYWSVDYDISVIRLKASLPLSDLINVITLPSEGLHLPAGTEAVVTGWGTISEGGSISTQLQAVQVPLVGQEECRAAYGGINEVTDRMLCAGVVDGGKDACQGDSGGPLTVDGVLVGVVSWGVGCARPEYPGVYANVAELHSFVREVAGV